MLVTCGAWPSSYGRQKEIRFLCWGAVPLLIHVNASHTQCCLTTDKDQTTVTDLIIYTYPTGKGVIANFLSHWPGTVLSPPPTFYFCDWPNTFNHLTQLTQFIPCITHFNIQMNEFSTLKMEAVCLSEMSECSIMTMVQKPKHCHLINCYENLRT
jgi:hypothetical protein